MIEISLRVNFWRRKKEYMFQIRFQDIFPNIFQNIFQSRWLKSEKCVAWWIAAWSSLFHPSSHYQKDFKYHIISPSWSSWSQVVVLLITGVLIGLSWVFLFYDFEIQFCQPKLQNLSANLNVGQLMLQSSIFISICNLLVTFPYRRILSWKR